MKNILMKTYLKISFFLFASVLIFSSCAKEEVTVIVPKTLAEYKLQNSQFISSEKAIVESCVIGYDKGNFRVSITSTFTTVKTNYLNVLNAAVTVLGKPDLTIADIVAANKTLGISGKAFLTALFISDRRPLVDPIVAADALNTATTVGTATGQVLIAAKTAFTAAITAAKATRDATTTIDRQVTEALDKLSVAKTTFSAAIIK